VRVWRIAHRDFIATAFTGEGSKKAGGRWNRKGEPVIYTSASPALAVLEMLAHMELRHVGSTLVLIPADIPDAFQPEVILRDQLPANWRQTPAPAELARLGTKWLRSESTLVLAVPCAIVPRETNYLINPRHPDFARITIGVPEPLEFDLRLLSPRG